MRIDKESVWVIPTENEDIRLSKAEGALVIEKAAGLVKATAEKAGTGSSGTVAKVALGALAIGLAGLAVAAVVGAVARADRTSYVPANRAHSPRQPVPSVPSLSDQVRHERDTIWNESGAGRASLDRFCRIRTLNYVTHGICITKFLAFRAGGESIIPLDQIRYLGYAPGRRSYDGQYYLITRNREYCEFGEQDLVTHELVFATSMGYQIIRLRSPEPAVPEVVRVRAPRPSSLQGGATATGEPSAQVKLVSPSDLLGPLQLLGGRHTNGYVLKESLRETLNKHHREFRRVLTEGDFNRYYKRS